MTALAGERPRRGHLLIMARKSGLANNVITLLYSCHDHS
jgi:hypothetical protein